METSPIPILNCSDSQMFDYLNISFSFIPFFSLFTDYYKIFLTIITVILSHYHFSHFTLPLFLILIQMFLMHKFYNH